MDVVKVGLLGLVGVLCAIQLKASKPEFGILAGIATCLLIFSYSMTNFQTVLSVLERLNTILGESRAYIKIILKVIGITYVCEFCAGICKDSGYGAIANQIEIFGKLAVLLAGLPIIVSIMETIQGF